MQTAPNHTRYGTFAITVDDAASLAQGLGEGRTLPLSWYADDAVCDAEQTRIFRASWQYVARADQLRAEGDFITCEVGGVPVVVVRDRGGKLNAFHNVCRHRGAQVVLESEGQRRRLQCHYHAWTYGLDGQLRGAPRSDREDCFVKEELGLRAASVDVWGPFVFVHLQADAPPLAQALGKVPDLVAAAGIAVDSLRHHVRVEYDLECNWKVAIENYLECYHCPTAHPGFSDVLDTRVDAYELVVEPTFAWAERPATTICGRRDTANRLHRPGGHCL